jgi:hypothetical protein
MVRNSWKSGIRALVGYLRGSRWHAGTIYWSVALV